MMHAALDPVDFVEDRRKRLTAMMVARVDVEHCRRRDRRRNRTPRKEAIAVALDAQRAAVVYPECSQPFVRRPRRELRPELDMELVRHDRCDAAICGHARERQETPEIDRPIEGFPTLVFIGKAGLLT